jgi:hypothetical protein
MLKVQHSEIVLKKVNPTPTLKLYRFVFDMLTGATYGGQFRCYAKSEMDAWRQLGQSLPGAHEAVKELTCLH